MWQIFCSVSPTYARRRSLARSLDAEREREAFGNVSDERRLAGSRSSVEADGGGWSLAERKDEAVEVEIGVHEAEVVRTEHGRRTAGSRAAPSGQSEGSVDNSRERGLRLLG